VKSAKQRSLSIGKRIAKDLMQMKKEASNCKVVMLGTGDSGKITILKQLSIIHDDGFSPESKENNKKAIWKQVAVNLCRLYHGAHSRQLLENLGCNRMHGIDS
jgi:hypothetical protein